MTGYLQATLVTCDNTVRTLAQSGDTDKILAERETVFVQLDARASDAAFMVYIPRASAAPGAVDGTNAAFELMPGIEYRIEPAAWAEGALPVDLSRFYVQSAAVEAANVKIRVRRRKIDATVVS